MQRFVKRYMSKKLAGIDFDIEAGQTAEQIKVKAGEFNRILSR